MPQISLSLSVGPQPLGILPPPAGFLVLPESDSPIAPEALSRLLAGDLSGPLPVEWEFYRLAAEGDLAGALSATPAVVPREEPNASILAYDRFVLSGDLGPVCALASFPTGDLGRLLACAAFAAGESDCVPDPGPTAEPTVAAVVWMVRAAIAIDEERIEAALAALDRGIEAVRSASPSFAAQLLAQRSALLLKTERRLALAALREAISLVSPAPEDARSPVRAALCLALGELLQDAASGDRSGLLESIGAYQAAIRAGLSLENGAESYALAQNNLGLAYLALPMSAAGSPLRMGIAVQSFREALKVWTPESHPEAWSSAQLNLANALQYLPSSHPEENLAQAVEIYEQLLELRSRAKDPLGYARLLANQANALAHLGMFSPALVKLEEAHRLFHWHGEPELAASTFEQVARINERLAARTEPAAGASSVAAAAGGA